MSGNWALDPSTDCARLSDAVKMFLQSREAIGCTASTLRTYRIELAWLLRMVGLGQTADITRETIERVLANRRTEVKSISAHRTYRVLRTFCRWCVCTGRLPTDPMLHIRMRLPKTLPQPPSDDDVRALLSACDATFEGRRNRLLVALTADSGLRKEELRRLRVADLDLTVRQVRVIAGKGQKDGVGLFGEATASILRAWLMVHPDRRPLTFLFVTRRCQQLGPSSITQILYRLSARAGLPRKIGPHALRHYAATSILRRTGDLELTRRVLRHESPSMTLRYAIVTQAEIAARYQAGSPMDHLSTALHRRLR